jgi:hypothetical protein
LNPNIGSASPLLQLPSGPISFIDMGSSPNLYTALVSESSSLLANQTLNLIAFNRRRNTNDFGNTGFVQMSLSTNNGVTFDSTFTIVGDTSDSFLCRYPTGAILNPIGNTNPQNAYLVSSGPWHPNENWAGNFFSSRQLNGAHYSPRFVLMHGFCFYMKFDLFFGCKKFQFVAL